MFISLKDYNQKLSTAASGDTYMTHVFPFLISAINLEKCMHKISVCHNYIKNINVA